MADKLYFLKVLYTQKLENAREQLKDNENLTELEENRLRYEIVFIVNLLKEINA